MVWRYGVGVFTIWASLISVLISIPKSAHAVDVPGTSVRLAWNGATGPVSGYDVQVSRNGGAYRVETRVVSSAVQLAGSIGQTLLVRIAAFDVNGRRGSFSPVSDSVRFVSGPTPPPPSSTTVDLDGNGLSDAVAVSSSNGGVQGVLLQTDGSRRWTTIGTPRDAAMRPAGFADVNGDARADVVMRNPSTGANELWLMRGLTYSVVALPSLAPRFRVAALRDFTGDRKADVLWHDYTRGESWLWVMGASGYQTARAVDRAPVGSRLEAVADVDGDRAPDLVWRNTTTRVLDAWLLTGVTPRAVTRIGTAPIYAKVVGVGDFNRDGKDDLVWSTPTSTGLTLRVWFLAGMNPPRSGIALRVPKGSVFRGVADVNSNGRDDFVIGDSPRTGYQVSPVYKSGSTTDWQTTAIPLGSGPSGAFSFLSLD
jgi:hypothetical protein